MLETSGEEQSQHTVMRSPTYIVIPPKHDKHTDITAFSLDFRETSHFLLLGDIHIESQLTWSDLIYRTKRFKNKENLTLLGETLLPKIMLQASLPCFALLISRPPTIKGGAQPHMVTSRSSTVFLLSVKFKSRQLSAVVMPRHTRLYINEPTDEAMINAKSYMTVRERELFEYFAAIYTDNAMTPFCHVRTAKQRHNMTLVSNWETWDEVISGFSATVELYKFLCLDIEGFHELETDATSTDWRLKRRLTYLILGNLEGQVLVLDMDSLHNRVGDNACGNEPLVSVPRLVFQWLRQERIVVFGSDVVGDCSKYGIPATSLVDSAAVFRHYLRSNDDFQPLINVGSTSRTGLGIQFYYSKKFDNKTMPPSKFRKLYGRINSRGDEDGRAAGRGKGVG